MNGELRANREYNRGTLGFYVVNERTDIAVAGPFFVEGLAHSEADHRNAEVPLGTDQLIVREIVSSSWVSRDA